ncbi:11098_t:CDS:2 [Dentiscutata erythropus]|uniref:11098_t:CDS:1 n=1 Tax=Dentiscutata erythropus TaxID=1348616 RepID=A0A9N8W7H6_9GLOM|nr:11098_t:CDS:2 [Dentiscutata erythropus]
MYPLFKVAFTNSGAVHHEKSSEEKEVFNFLLEADKKIVGEDIRRHNKEKKLSKAEQASLNQDQESDTGHRKKGAENIVQLIAGGNKDDAQSSDKTIPCDVISIESLNQNLSTDSLLSLAQLFNKADDAEYGAIRANQEEILCWYYYGKEFLTQVTVIVQDGKGKIGEKKAKRHNDNNVEEVSSHMTEVSAGGPGQNHVTKNPETRIGPVDSPKSQASVPSASS